MLLGTLTLAGMSAAYYLLTFKRHYETTLQFSPYLMKAIWPFICFLPFAFVTPNYFTIIVFIFLNALVITRVGSLMAYPTPSNKPTFSLKSWQALCVVSVLTAVFVLYGFLIQYRFFGNLYLGHSDWCGFLIVANNTLKGKCFLDNEGINFLGHHFMPAAFLVICAYIYLFRSIGAFFVLASLVVYGSAPILYSYAVKKGLSPFSSLVLTTAWLLQPSLANMLPAIFYGFHGIYVVMPFLSLYFLTLALGYRKTAWLLMIFTLLIQETVAIFWVGLSIVYFLQKKYRLAVWMFAISTIYFFITVKLVIPWIGENNYPYAGMYYGELGKSATDIAFSLLTNPYVVLTRLLRLENAFLVSVILLPFAIAHIRYPTWLIASTGIFAGICLKDDIQLSSINSWYQSEIMIITFISAAAGMVLLEPERSQASTGRWLKFYSWITTGDTNRQPTPNIMVCSLLISSFLCFYFFSIGCYFGKNSWAKHINATQFFDEINQIKSFIPEKASISATDRIAAHFILRNEVFLCPSPGKDYILFDLEDQLGNSASIEEFRKQMLESQEYKLIYYAPTGNHTFLLFKKGQITHTAVPLPIVDYSNWQTLGMPVKLDTEIPVQCRVIQNNQKQHEITLLFRVMEPVNHDVTIHVDVIAGNGETLRKKTISYAFGNGIQPLYHCTEGTVFEIKLDVPQNTHFMNVSLKPRHPVIGSNNLLRD
ncbi:MAG: DUF2079 domain-containing protein [Victivallales bacterium]|nr:DUF2079 domain-containing protein [Victivallales bacterium]